MPNRGESYSCVAQGGETLCSLYMREVVDSQLVADLEDPDHCLLPEIEWPLSTPRSKVYPSDHEWFLLCKAGFERGMFSHIAEAEIF